MSFVCKCCLCHFSVDPDPIPATTTLVSKVLNHDNLSPAAPSPAAAATDGSRADPIPSTASVDAKKRPCSMKPADPISKDADNTSSSLAPLDDEDLLQEILLRLPPKPSVLPRASLVCTRWRRILSDTQFLSRYRKHHRKPPLLGFFAGSTSTHHDFVPVLDKKPDCIPTARFSVPKSSKSYHHWDFLGCRHGLAILLINWRREVIVWDPLTGQQHRMSSPPGLHETEGEKFWVWHAAVLCADDEDGHVHGDCFSSPFKLVLVCSGRTQASACLYESLSGVWRNIVLTTTTEAILQFRPSILIGNALFWLLSAGGVLAFDIDRPSLGEIEKPVDAHHTDCFSFQLLRTDDSGLGFAVLSKLSIHIWEKKLNSDAIQWVPLQKIFPRGMRSDLKEVEMNCGNKLDAVAILQQQELPVGVGAEAE
ncbi:F-box/kelch-repeat protein At3g23880-like [Triticum aestivum]|uniref:F-box/kelch-repeat protein At3g23880-like n=1 Tax=Triticum aestivum TaxID=4565 RepID=UPI001D005DE0|nr:F-box/kelch-repeat protein At3g23880-like [Triticum aestivum]